MLSLEIIGSCFEIFGGVGLFSLSVLQSAENGTLNRKTFKKGGLLKSGTFKKWDLCHNLFAADKCFSWWHFAGWEDCNWQQFIGIINGFVIILVFMVILFLSWLPYSTYLYLDFHLLCSMTKLKEHSREICYLFLIIFRVIFIYFTAFALLIYG